MVAVHQGNGYDNGKLSYCKMKIDKPPEVAFHLRGQGIGIQACAAAYRAPHGCCKHSSAEQKQGKKITQSKCISKVNGENVTNTILKKIGEILIDIHGQHQNHSLLLKKNHLSLLDKYAKDELEELLTLEALMALSATLAI